MTEQINSQISAFVDDELLEEECGLLIRRLCSDDELQDRVSRFALIGDVMRGENLVARESLIQRISQEIDGAEQVQTPEVKVPAEARAPWPRWLKPASGVAVAATVAAVSVLSLQGLNDEPANNLPSASAALYDEGNNAAVLNPINLPRIPKPDIRPVSVMPQSQLDGYLLRHRGYSNRVGGPTLIGIRNIGRPNNSQSKDIILVEPQIDKAASQQ